MTCFLWNESTSLINDAGTWKLSMGVNALHIVSVPSATFSAWTKCLISTARISARAICMALLFIYRLKNCPKSNGTFPPIWDTFDILIVALCLTNHCKILRHSPLILDPEQNIALKQKLHSTDTWIALSNVIKKEFPNIVGYPRLEYYVGATEKQWHDWELKLEMFSLYLMSHSESEEAFLRYIRGPHSESDLEQFLKSPLGSPESSYDMPSLGPTPIPSPTLGAQMSDMTLYGEPSIKSLPSTRKATTLKSVLQLELSSPMPASGSLLDFHQEKLSPSPPHADEDLGDSKPQPPAMSALLPTNVLESKLSPFERCSPRYHLSLSPDWYRRDITPRNPLHHLTPFPMHSSSPAVAPTPRNAHHQSTFFPRRTPPQGSLPDDTDSDTTPTSYKGK